jgi:hypothetical protein
MITMSNQEFVLGCLFFLGLGIGAAVVIFAVWRDSQQELESKERTDRLVQLRHMRVLLQSAAQTLCVDDYGDALEGAKLRVDLMIDQDLRRLRTGGRCMVSPGVIPPPPPRRAAVNRAAGRAGV